MEIIKDKECYKNIWENFWNHCLEEAKKSFDNITNEDDIITEATEIFEETANVEQIVGYYIVYHEENALKDWKINTDGIIFNEQDKQVDKILKELYHSTTS